MKVSEKTALVRAYFEKESIKQERKDHIKHHDALRRKDFVEKTKIFESRKHSMMIHEKENDAKKLARQKEVDIHQKFLKLSTSLNII